MSRVSRSYAPLEDPRPARNDRLAAANLDLSPGFERIDGKLYLRIKAPLVLGRDGFYTVEQGGDETAQESAAPHFTTGPDFPADPSAGDIHSLQGELYTFDVDRAKWLGRVWECVFGDTGTVAAGVRLLIDSTVIGSATRGVLVPFDCTLVEISSWKANAATTCQLDIQAGGTVRYSHTITPAGSESVLESGINTDFLRSDILNVVANTALTNGGGICMVFRKRGP